MKDYIKNNWKFLLFVLSSGLLGGYCTGLYIPEMYSQEMLQQLQEQGMTTELLALSGAVQYGILYGAILAAIGLIISKKVGLWKEFRFDKNAVLPTTVITIIAALCLFPGDKLIFGSFSSWVNDVYNISPGLPKIIAGLLGGGVIEEVMMRQLFMSLMALIISKLFRLCNDSSWSSSSDFRSADGHIDIRKRIVWRQLSWIKISEELHILLKMKKYC